MLSVADQGPGVPDAEKKKIFDRFYRGSQSRTDPSHFGLGLSVAWELAAVHGGKISVSDTPGGEDNISQYENFWTDAPRHTFEALKSLLATI